MILDLFSHKIHSASEEWPEKLAEIASIFGEFDGKLYDRTAFENRLQSISPRASYLARDAASKPLTNGGRLDVSKFRDEISAYPSYLGLYHLEQSTAGWVVRVSETAKRFLLKEEADVASFLRLQLPLFQYPNAMGAAYYSHTNNLRVQENAKNRTLDFISKGIHFSPIRLIAVALKADAQLKKISVLNAAVSFKEIFGLANHHEVNRYALPAFETVLVVLDKIRQGRVKTPLKTENRFHTLAHTEMFTASRGVVKLREGVNDADRLQLIQRLDAIASIQIQFNDFDYCKTGEDIRDVIASSNWGRYFDGIKVLPADIVETLTSDTAEEYVKGTRHTEESEHISEPVAVTYPFRDRTAALPPVRPYDRKRELADPEIRRIKLQRRNLAHKELIDKMASWLREIGAQPKENDHIDLFAKIPWDGSFIFEMKSGGDSLLEQIRKGLSQLYEYRYRYKDTINDNHISLCLVLPEDPKSIPWIIDYLCTDRNINLCWFEKNGQLVWPAMCSPEMAVLKGQA